MGRDKLSNFEQEEQDLQDQLARGEITIAEYNKQMRDIQRYEREIARTEREDAHEQLDRDMGWDRW